jgi:GDP-L-fucose synthase
VIPANVYGPHDTFDDHKSHVIPALIKKAFKAKEEGTDLEIWGTGKATREFIYADDCSEAIVRAMESYNEPEPINIGTGIESSILEIADFIKSYVGVKGKLRFNSSFPDGAAGRVFDVSRMVNELNFKPKTLLGEGIMKTVDYYRSTL